MARMHEILSLIYPSSSSCVKKDAAHSAAKARGRLLTPTKCQFHLQGLDYYILEVTTDLGYHCRIHPRMVSQSFYFSLNCTWFSSSSLAFWVRSIHEFHGNAWLCQMVYEFFCLHGLNYEWIVLFKFLEFDMNLYVQNWSSNFLFGLQNCSWTLLNVR